MKGKVLAALEHLGSLSPEAIPASVAELAGVAYKTGE